ncbi:MAG: hypothetical protein WBW45_18715 [Bradyrhizobium sp.]|uniref:hypothetical protein n=1 Tax=Bradyrhizobium sp. TaxID=376 RepID=UPI003C37C017
MTKLIAKVPKAGGPGRGKRITAQGKSFSGRADAMPVRRKVLPRRVRLNLAAPGGSLCFQQNFCF